MIVVAWLVQLLNLWSPPERRAESLLKEAQESKAQASARYLAIVEAAVEVAYMPEESPVIVARNDDEKSRSWTALLLLSVAYFESGFRRDVDLGIGRMGRGDGGKSWCLMQVNLGTGKVADPDPVVSSWTGKDLVADHKKCLRVGLRMLRRSFTACSKEHFAHRMSVYASGSCDKGHDESNARLSFFTRELKRPLFSKPAPLGGVSEAARSSP